MKKTQLTLTFVMAAFTLLQAQSARMAWGELLDSKKNVSDILGEYDGDVYSIAKKRMGCYFYRCNSKNLKMEVQTEVEIPEIDGKRPEIEGYQMVKGQVVVFASKEVKDVHTLYAFSIDKNGVISQKPKKMFSVNLGDGSREEFLFKTSLDKSRLLVLQKHILRKEKKQVVGARVFNENLELINEAKKVMPTKEDDEKINIKSFATDNNGDIYLLFNRTDRKGMILSFEAFHFTIEKETFDYELDLNKLVKNAKEEMAISTAIFDVNTEGDLCIGGFYYGKMKNTWYNKAIKGTFFIRIDGASHKVATVTAEPFDEEAKSELLKDKDLAKNKEIPPHYEPKHIIFKEDGGVVMVSEYYTLVMIGNMAIKTYGPILVTSIAKDGSIEWVRALFKNQVYSYNTRDILASVMDRSVLYSYVVGVRDGSIYIVFNDNPKNLTAKNLKERYHTLMVLTKSIPVVMVLDKKGNLSKREVLDGANEEENEVKIRPGVSTQVNNMEVILYGTKGNGDKLGRLYLE